MWQAGATLHRGARASHYRGLSRRGAQAPDARAQQLWLTGLVAPQACGIFPNQGSNPCPLHWGADSQPLRHQGSPVSIYSTCVLNKKMLSRQLLKNPSCLLSLTRNKPMRNMPPLLRCLFRWERFRHEGQKLGEAPTSSSAGVRWTLLLASRIAVDPSFFLWLPQEMVNPFTASLLKASFIPGGCKLRLAPFISPSSRNSCLW